MSVKAVYHTKHLPDHGVELPPTTRFVLFLIADYANEENVAWPKYNTLVRYSGLHRATIIRAVNELVERGLLERQERTRPDGSDTSNGYRLTYIPEGSTMRPHSDIMSPGGRTQRQEGRTVRPPPSHSATPRTISRTVTNKKPPLPPTPTPEPTPAAEEDDRQTHMSIPNTQPDPEVTHALTMAERRRATNHAGSLLAQQHPLVWAALTDLQAIYTWKPAQFAAIAEQLLNLARTTTDSRVELACRAVIEAGATISHPIAYVRKLLTTDAPTARHNAPTSLLADLPDPSAWTLD